MFFVEKKFFTVLKSRTIFCAFDLSEFQPIIQMFAELLFFFFVDYYN